MNDGLPTNKPFLVGSVIVARHGWSAWALATLRKYGLA